MKSFLQSQYKMVCSARNVLFEYCEKIKPDDLLKENKGFGRGGSIRNLLVHIGNSYQGWLSKYAMERDISLTPYESIATISEVKDYYSSIDVLLEEFLTYFEMDYTRDLLMIVHGRQVTSNPFELFTHVITHEFHHKGQILSISRQWGYMPVDTDIMRF